jgi:tRNA nucleotidyltransferase (CCA-adding enzyme)
MVKFYRVGGCVRDALLNRRCKDIDYSVEAESYEAMVKEIEDRGGEIFLESPQYLTVRAKVLGMGACDFVLCRKDGQYFDGRHPESVEPGSIYDDLARRDFTMNAIAEDEHGSLLDPHGGQMDIARKVIRCVGDPRKRFGEDALRLLRALRFAVVLDFNMHVSVLECLGDEELVSKLACVSIERIREELLKAFKANTLETLRYLERFRILRREIFEDDVLWLMPTLKG